MGAGEGVDDIFEAFGVDLGDVAAVSAHQVMMVMFLVGAGELVAFFPADVDYRDDVETLEEFKRAVNTNAITCGRQLDELADRERFTGLLQGCEYVQARSCCTEVVACQ